MSDKSFKVRSGLQIPGVTSANILTTDSSGNVSSSSVLSISAGGTGQTSADNALNALLPLQTNNENKYLQTNGVTTQWNAVTYLPPTANAISSSITLASNNRYFVDTTSARSLTLPLMPSLGDEIQIYDASNSALTNNITVLPNSNKIQGSVQSLIIDSNAATVYLTYTGSTYGWAVN
jgi:hypothetical protein